MIYNQFIDGDVTLSDGVTSFVHLDDAVETSIQAINFDNGIYNVADDEPVKVLILLNGIRINYRLIQNNNTTRTTI